MSISLNYEFLFVGRDEEAFLENYAYDIREEDEAREGHLFVSVEVQNNPADAQKIGDVIFDTVREVYFESSSSEDTYDRFEEALKEVNKKLRKIKSEKMSGYIGNLNVLISVFQNGILHLTQCGDSEAYLIRRKFVSSVTEGLADGADSDDVFSNIASGTIEIGDVVIFSSTRLLRYMTKNDLAKASVAADVVGVLGDLKDLISTEILGKVGLAAIMFKKQEADGEFFEENDIPKLDMVEEKTEELVSSHGVSRRSYDFKRWFSAGALTDLQYNLGDFFSGFRKGRMNKQRILVLLIAVILLLTFGIWYARGNAQEKAYVLSLDESLQKVQESIDTAKTQGQYDKEAAGVTLSNAESKAMEVLNSGYYRNKANELLTAIQNTRDLLDNVKRVTDPKVYADLTTKRDNVSALGLIPGKSGHLFVFEYNALYELVLNELKDPLTLDDSEVVIAGTNFDDRGSLAFLTKSGKLLEYKDGTINFMDTEEQAFHKAVDLEDWGNKIYLLDSENNQIWKYTYSGAREKFSAAESYLVEGDVKTGVSFVIDGSVYVLANDGYITRLFAGSKVDMPVKKEPFTKPQSATKIWTDPDSTQLFVLDSSGSRLYSYFKDTQKNQLVYSNQYVFENVGELRDFYIDKAANKVYLLDAQKVYEADL